MKTIYNIMIALVLITAASFAEIADLAIENERVEGEVFTFEISIQRGDEWSGDALGHADFYFNYNEDAIGSAVTITNLHPALDGNSAYDLSGAMNGGLVHIKIDFVNGGGALWLPGVNLAEIICTVELDITDASQMSELEWNILNTGLLTSDLSSIQETFEGSGDISLPVELAAFEGRYVNGTVELFWRTESEFQNWGFHIYRSTARDGRYERINSTIIKGAGSSTMPLDYSYVDERVDENSIYYYKLENVDMNGGAERSSPIVVQTGGTTISLIDAYTLEQNYPNPFNPSTTISFTLAHAEDVELAIYTIDGRLVKQLVHASYPAGVHSVVWDGSNQFGGQAPSGSYLYQLRTKNYQQTKKLTLLH